MSHGKFYLKCQRCEFFVEHNKQEGVEQKYRTGSCREDSPRVVMSLKDHKPITRFPVVSASSGCAKFKEMEKQEVTEDDSPYKMD